MSDKDFESYLDSLTRSLRIDPQKRDDIRRELRAHCLDALEQERADGRRPREILRSVIDDFGDATELAARLSINHIKRRWIMRGSAAAACIAAFILSLQVLPPVGDVPSVFTPAAAVAQTPQIEKSRNDLLRERLRARIAEVSFEDAPLEQVFEWLNAFSEFNMYVHWRHLEELGVNRDAPVTMNLRDVSVETLLQMLVDEFSDDDLAYQVVDGVLVISTRFAMQLRTTTEVYDVGDILELIDGQNPWNVCPEAEADVGRAGGRPFASIFSPKQDSESAPDAPAPDADPVDLNSAQQLVRLLTNAVEPNSWQSNGGIGYLQIMNEIMVVRQYPGVHMQIADLLRDMRAVAARM